MGILFESAEYSEYTAAKTWQKCRDAIKGDDAIKAESVQFDYLPKLPAQTNDEYRRYKERSVFYGAAGRVKSALMGFLFRKPMQVQADSLDEFTIDVDLRSTRLEEFIKDEIASEILEVGRVAVLVDLPAVELDTPQPYFIAYKAEDVYFWEENYVGGRWQLSEARIAYSTLEEDPRDPLARVAVERVLHLYLDEDGVYTQQRWVKHPKTNEFVLDGEPVVPIVAGRTLDYIPLVFMNSSHTKPDIQQPPLKALIDQSISHYQVLTDYLHGVHFSALPQLVIAGNGVDTTQKYTIGSATAWPFRDPNVKVYYAEVKGDFPHADYLEKAEKRMLTLGARMIEPHRSGVETAETSRIRQSSEASVLTDIADTISAGMTRLLRIVAEWLGVDDDVSVTLNKDFIDHKLSPQEMMALAQTHQAGLLPDRALHYALQQGEILPNDMDLDEWQDAQSLDIIEG